MHGGSARDRIRRSSASTARSHTRTSRFAMQRRDFLKSVVIAAGAGGTGVRAVQPAAATAEAPQPAAPLDQRICLFTDHVDDFGYSYTDVAAMLSPLGIAGPDLTVRSGGLVPPERVADELPKA